MKTILITGTTNGIGRVTAFNLARQGHKIVMANRNRQKSEQLAKEITEATGNTNISLLDLDLSSLSSVHDSSLFSGHFHDTRAMGMANVYGALRAGIRNFDASVGGLGGCPFAPGATGNVATEDLVMMLHQMGYETGIDLEKLMMAGKLAGELTETCTGGRANKWRRLQLEKQRPLS